MRLVGLVLLLFGCMAVPLVVPAPLRAQAPRSDTLPRHPTKKPAKKPVKKPVTATAHAAVAHAAIKKAPPTAKPVPPPPQTVPTAAPGAEPIPAGTLATFRATKLMTAPGASALGELASGTTMQPLARERGWVRVRVEGWVPERDLAPADSSLGATLTAADLRADPEGTRGKLVRWEVQALSVQTADPLRPEMAHEEPYLLAKGPGAENALLYLTIPPSLLNAAKALPPLSKVIVTARVRSGRSEPLGTPILDLKSIAPR